MIIIDELDVCGFFLYGLMPVGVGRSKSFQIIRRRYISQFPGPFEYAVQGDGRAYGNFQVAQAALEIQEK